MSLPGTRSPLGNSTNDLHAPTPSPSFATAKSTQSKQIRRKVSVRAFRPHVDSSEDLPSEHSSIFEALWANPSVESFDRRAPTSAPGDQPLSPIIGNTSNDFPPPQRTISPSAHLRTLHIPTQLTTITEQKSLATLRPPPSLHSLKAALQPRRKTSFSLDDLSLFHHPKNPTRTLNPSSSSSSSTNTSTIPPPTYPNHPQHWPPFRVPTPPGLPTFNTPAAIHYRLPAPRLRFREWFSLTPSAAEERYVRQTAGLPRGVLMRGEDGVLVRGRWRPGVSAHTAGLEGHRFWGGGVEVVEGRGRPEAGEREVRGEERGGAEQRGGRRTEEGGGGEEVGGVLGGGVLCLLWGGEGGGCGASAGCGGEGWESGAGVCGAGFCALSGLRAGVGGGVGSLGGIWWWVIYLIRGADARF